MQIDRGYNFEAGTMAQAARLSLRMQKELKLLLSDPPPGASFPFLTADGDAALSSPSSSSSSSLTTIDAEIEGPEGTVYSGGIFKIRIQIPERYPFQPPAVTFATPIYHPNIDNGGRICLDILNLPPKGAWQPSLNVSTVITSIGLLLSEPNPDDGLMCDASREFKYNRQAFDLKARTMTEKYAKASSGMVSSSQGTEQTVELRLTGDTEVGDEIKTEDSKKLPLDLAVSRCEKDGNEKANEVTAAVRYTLEFKKKSEPEESSQKLNTNEVYSVGDFCKKQKLSLSSLGKPKQSGCHKQNSPVDQQVPPHSTTTKIRAVNGSKLQSCQVSNYNQQEHDMHPASQGKVSSTSENCKRYTCSKKLSLGFSVMSSNQDTCENENTMPVRKLTGERLDKTEQDLSSNSVKPEFAKQGGPRGGSGDTDLNKRKCKVESVLAKEEVEEPRELPFSDPKPCSIPQQRRYTKECQSSIDHRDASQNKLLPDPSLTVIVLDSDESDEEERSRCRRSKLSLLSKRPSWGNTKEHKAL